MCDSNYMIIIHLMRFPGLSILQNGNIPLFLTEDLIKDIFNTYPVSPCVSNLREGLGKLGIHQVCILNVQKRHCGSLSSKSKKALANKAWTVCTFIYISIASTSCECYLPHHTKAWFLEIILLTIGWLD